MFKGPSAGVTITA